MNYSRSIRRLLGPFIIFLINSFSLSAQDCLNDTIPPVAVCSQAISTSLFSDGLFTFDPLYIASQSTDNCGIASYRIAVQDGVSHLAQPPAATEFTLNCCYEGVNKLTAWVIDSSGNWDTCHTTLYLQDYLSVCDTSSVTCFSPIISGKVFVDANVNCTNDQEAGLAGVELQLQRIPDGALYLTTTTDSVGHYEFILPYHDGSDYSISILNSNLQSASYPCGMQSIFSIPSSTSILTQDIPVFFKEISGTLFWDENENCTNDNEPGPGFISVRASNLNDSSIVYETRFDDSSSYQFLLPYDTTSNYFLEIVHEEILIGVDILPGSFPCGDTATINFPSGGFTAIHDFPVLPHVLTGYVFYDENSNCIFDSSEAGIVGISVSATQFYPNGSSTIVTQTDSNGLYHINRLVGDTSPWVLEVRNMPSTALSCGSMAAVSFIGDSLLTGHDFGTQLVGGCPFLITDISTPNMERCFNTTYYSFNCNYSDSLAENVYLEIQLDTFLQVNSSTLPWIAVDSNKYTFFLDSLLPGECLNFELDVTVSCDAQLGQTHCVEANIYPNNDCIDPDPNWSGAIIQTAASCEGDSVRLSVMNEGTGDMSGPLLFTVVEDLVMLMEEEFDLDVGGVRTLKVPANGSTWRIEAMQEPGYPHWPYPASWIEGCGGINNTGIVLQFPTNITPAFTSIDCRSNTGSFDPNDKQSFPVGVSEQHYIYPNRPIDYLIRFQNTGTAPAHKVVVIDTISSHLNWASIRVGASSHKFEYQVLEDGVIQFVFEDINLPDSTTNEAASHGFVKFQIDQQADLPDETLIENSAAIYFDFNDPIITNVSQLKVKEMFLEQVVGSLNTLEETIQIQLFPNPVNDVATLRVQGYDLQQGHFRLFDASGQLVRKQAFSANEVLIERDNLQPGIYFYQILSGQQYLASGKLIVH